MRILPVIILLFLLPQQKAIGQNNVSIKYYDSSWSPTSRTSAHYFAEYIQIDSIFKATGYWIKSGKVKYIIYYSDTSLNKRIGLSKKFYENGQIEDSSFYNEDGKIINSFYYYQNGNLWVRYTYDVKHKSQTTEAYDINNKRLENFTFFREPDFKVGNMDWQSYLAQKIKSKVPVRNGAPSGQYQVIIKFIVNENGKITDISPETNFGYGMEEEVIRVISKSPKWNPAIWLNKPSKAYRRQPLTFVVSE